MYVFTKKSMYVYGVVVGHGQAGFPFPSHGMYHVHAISIGSSTYVGMITVGRAKQQSKASSDMLTREVGRDTLVRA